MSTFYSAAIVPAAGVGKRMGGGTAKQFLPLLGLPVLAHTLRLLQSAPELDAIVVATLPEMMDEVTALAHAHSCTKLAAVVAGGTHRQDSVRAGLQTLRDLLEPRVAWPNCIVAVHDAARPLLPVSLLSNILLAAREHPALVMAVPVKDTIKIADADEVVVTTPPRYATWAAQTPQVFALDLLWQAHRQAADEGYYGTDDAQLVERLGQPVRIFRGSEENLKLTTPTDLVLAEAILKGRER